MSENIMKTIYVIRVYDEEWDEWNDIYAVSSRVDALDALDALDECLQRQNKGNTLTSTLCD